MHRMSITAPPKRYRSMEASWIGATVNGFPTVASSSEETCRSQQVTAQDFPKVQGFTVLALAPLPRTLFELSLWSVPSGRVQPLLVSSGTRRECNSRAVSLSTAVKHNPSW